MYTRRGDIELVGHWPERAAATADGVYLDEISSTGRLC